MKKIITFFFLALILVGCGQKNNTDIYPSVKSNGVHTSAFLLAPDGSKIAISTEKGNFIYDYGKGRMNEINDNSVRFEELSWTYSNNAWELVKANNELKLNTSEQQLVFSKEVLEGDIYDPVYNKLGVLELRLINWDNSKVLALQNRVNGKFNVIKEMREADNIEVWGISRDIAVIKVSLSTSDYYKLYSKNLNNIIDINTNDILQLYKSLNMLIKDGNTKDNEIFYHRNVNLGSIEIIDLSYKNNVILYIDNYTKKLMLFNMISNEIFPVNQPNILNAISINNSEIYAIAKSDRKFKVQRISPKAGVYQTIFFTNEFLYKLWEYENEVFFAGVITKGGENKYKFYRVVNNGVESVFKK